MIRKLLLLALAMLALRMAGRAVRNNAEIMAALWTLVGLTASLNQTNTAKARSTEARLAGVVTSLGTTNANVANAQTTANNAYPKTGGTISGSATVAGDHTVNGTFTANGGSTSEFSAGIHTAGAMQADNGVNTSNVNSNGGSTNEFAGAVHTSGNMQADGSVLTTDLYVSGQRIAPGQGRPGAYPAVGSPSNSGLATYCNQIVGGLLAAGIFV
jgi:hypothetical protein